MDRLLPRLGCKKTTETVDPYLNIRLEENNKQQVKERHNQHFWEVEVPRMVASGTYSTETMLEEGWLVYNDKGELELGKGPPQKK